MKDQLTQEQFFKLFPSNEACLSELLQHRYPNGIFCKKCHTTTKHYKVKNRPSFACSSCHNHCYPLSDTIFAKSVTPLRIWFYCLFLLVQSNGQFSAKFLSKKLQVTYKTAWRMKKYTIPLLAEVGTIPVMGLEETFMDALIRQQKVKALEVARQSSKP